MSDFGGCFDWIMSDLDNACPGQLPGHYPLSAKEEQEPNATFTSCGRVR